MFTINSFTTFLGWCSVVNIGMLLVIGLAIMLVRKPMMRVHSALLGVEERKLPVLYFRYISNYKLLTLMFNIVPYLVLKFAM